MPSLEVGVGSLLRRPGSRLEVDRELEVDAEVLDGRLDPGEPVRVRLTLESAQQGVVATGHVQVAWRAPCRRCLEEVVGQTDTPVREVFGGPDPDEGFPLRDETVDLEPLVREVAVLALPLAPLCGDDCRGPDPEHHPTGIAADDGPRRDPRWAALDDLDL